MDMLELHEEKRRLQAAAMQECVPAHLEVKQYGLDGLRLGMLQAGQHIQNRCDVCGTHPAQTKKHERMRC